MDQTFKINDPLLAGFEVRPVVSSNIDFIGIHFEQRKLFVQFKNDTAFIYDLSRREMLMEDDSSDTDGLVMQWTDMPATDDALIWEAFADENNSVGKVFHAYVRSARFSSEKYTHKLVSNENNG